jgi:xanthine dehydrogenase small subunit
VSLAIQRVESVRQGAAILAAEGGARFIGGGTLLVRAITAGLAIDKIVLPDGLGLDRITVEGGRAEIGAAATMASIAAHPALAFLKPVADSIGGPAIRSMATVGGNLFARSPFGDFAVALLALGATVMLEHPDRIETVDLETFLSGRERKAPRIVLGVGFDLPPSGAFRFAKVARTHPHGGAVLSIAALLPIVDGKLAGVRVAYGAMAPTPIRVRAVENALEGKALDDETIAAAAAAADRGCAPESDPYAGEWYRRTVLPVHLRRLLGT